MKRERGHLSISHYHLIPISSFTHPILFNRHYSFSLTNTNKEKRERDGGTEQELSAAEERLILGKGHGDIQEFEAGDGISFSRVQCDGWLPEAIAVHEILRWDGADAQAAAGKRSNLEVLQPCVFRKKKCWSWWVWRTDDEGEGEREDEI